MWETHHHIIPCSYTLGPSWFRENTSYVFEPLVLTVKKRAPETHPELIGHEPFVKKGTPWLDHVLQTRKATRDAALLKHLTSWAQAPFLISAKTSAFKKEHILFKRKNMGRYALTEQPAANPPAPSAGQTDLQASVFTLRLYTVGNLKGLAATGKLPKVKRLPANNFTNTQISHVGSFC